MNADWKDDEFETREPAEEENVVEEADTESEPAQVFDEEPAEETVFEEEQAEEPQTEEDDEQPDEGDVIEKLLGYLEDALENPKGSGFMGRSQVDVPVCLNIIDDIRQNMPVSLQYSVATSAQRERILGNAEQIAHSKVSKAVNEANARIEEASAQAEDIRRSAQEEADRLIEDAKAQAEDIIEKAKRKAMRMKNEEEILKEAKREASEIRSTTARDAKETRRKALSDAWLVYEAVQKQLNALDAKLDKYKNELVGPDDIDR